MLKFGNYRNLKDDRIDMKALWRDFALDNNLTQQESDKGYVIIAMAEENFRTVTSQTANCLIMTAYVEATK